MPGHGGRVLWFSAALRKKEGAVLTNGYRVLIDNRGTWTSGAGMGGYAPSDAAVAGVDGRVYVLGANRDCRAEFATCTAAPIRAYDPATNAWQTLGPLPVSRSQLAAAVDRHGRIFVVGGLTPDATALVRTVDVYDPGTNQWARAGSLPSERFQALAATTPDGRLWVLGGYAASGDPLASMDVFVPVS
jgi:N-acetylneuraminic acid mutarotase